MQPSKREIVGRYATNSDLSRGEKVLKRLMEPSYACMKAKRAGFKKVAQLTPAKAARDSGNAAFKKERSKKVGHGFKRDRIRAGGHHSAGILAMQASKESVQKHAALRFAAWGGHMPAAHKFMHRYLGHFDLVNFCAVWLSPTDEY